MSTNISRTIARPEAKRDDSNDDLPVIKGYTGASRYIYNRWNVHITARYLKRSCLDGSLPSFLLAGAMWFSPNDLR